jgi:hypothetical protein
MQGQAEKDEEVTRSQSGAIYVDELSRDGRPHFFQLENPSREFGFSGARGSQHD